MNYRVPLSALYRGARERVSQLVGDPADDARPVPATPGWTVHDVVAHLTGVAQDLVAGGTPRGGPTPEWTGGHVARGRGVPTSELVDLWAACAPQVEALLDNRPIWPVVMDAGSHEQDLRSALGVTGERDGALVVVGTKVLLRGLDVPAPLRVTTEHYDIRVGPGSDGKGGPSIPDEAQPDVVHLTTTTFEAFRWRLGRRSRAQLAAMAWSADPAPFLDHLCIFGPAAQDVVE